jgi:hypothetical protein
MKKRAITILIVIATVGIFLVPLLMRWEELRSVFTLNRQYIDSLTLPDQPAFTGFQKLIAAVKSYSRDHISHGKPLPDSLTLRDLVSGGYMTTNDVQALDISDATFYPAADMRDPKAVLVRLRMADGRQITTLADGSVQQLPQ